jgi:hypothetical protein
MSEFEVAFPERRRFDDRQLLIEDDGSDFESFVYEALSLLVDTGTLRPGFGRGRDGAIDHIVEGAEIRTVIECKFIGRHATSAPLDRWAEVRRHLRENLPKLATKGASERRGSPYAPWLDCERPIDSYQFVISFPFLHVQERSDLERQIADDFAGLSEKHLHLSHLARIHVQVRGWDDLLGELRRRFPLRYRWFGDLPRGIAPLRDKRFEARSFRRFLFQDSLRFFSREEYLATNSGEPIKREDQFVNNLSAEPGDEALIVTGAGGVGKTRLGFELCDRLWKIKWLPLRLTDSATSASVTDLIKAHAEPARIVLFSDYAERADGLSSIAEETARINDSKAHRVRIIATCRISALSSVEDALASLVPRKTTLGTRASEPVEIAFAEWVVRQILAYGHIPDAEQIAKVCHGLPILAAFALFLHERDPIQFNKQFGNLSGVRDFRDWVKRRLDTALYSVQSKHNYRQLLKHLALLSLRLPMSKNEADDLVDLSPLDAGLLEIMRKDRWIEDNEEQVVATHDVFADAMVGHYVFETREAAQTRLAELLRSAIDQGFLGRALLAIDRLAGHPDFEALDALEITRSLLARSPAAVVAVHETLLRGRFLSDRSKVMLLAESQLLYAAIQSNRECDIAVSHIAESLARSRRHDPSPNSSLFEEWIGVMQPLIATSLTNPQTSNMILRRAFALLPQIYQSSVLARVSAEPTVSPTHYLLVAWLNAGLPVNDISLWMQTWLVANAHWNHKTSFVVRAWLNAGGQRDLIDQHVMVWIKTFGAAESAGFVYPAWLHAGGQRDLIDQQVLAWIKAFGALENASFVYRTWLETGGQRDLIDQQVLAWIKAFGATEDAQFVYRAWLDAGGQRDLIDQHVLAWIKAFGATEDARFVYRAWLDVGGQRDLIDQRVLAWIRAFGATEDAQFVYRAWLDAGGQRELIDPSVLAWVGAFGATPGAQFVYRGWLAAGGDFELISGKCLAWFNGHAADYDASFLLKYIARQRDLPTESLHAAIRWCRRYAAEEDAVWRVASLLNNYAQSEEAVAVVRAFLVCLRLFDINRISVSSDANPDEDGYKLAFLVLNSLGISLGVIGLNDLDRQEIRNAHANLLRNSIIYEAAHTSGEPHVYPALIHNVAELIKFGLVDPKRDSAGLARFAAWMRAWPANAREDLALAVSTLRRVAPLEPWDGVLTSPLPHANSWGWKDDWQERWNDAQGNHCKLSSLAGQAKTWLQHFDLNQRGWTSIWKILWEVDDGSGRAELTEIARKWLQIVNHDHPRWASIWTMLWCAAPAHPDEVSLLVAQGRDWLLGEGQRIDWDRVWLALWNLSEQRDEKLVKSARLRIQFSPTANFQAIEDEISALPVAVPSPRSI